MLKGNAAEDWVISFEEFKAMSFHPSTSGPMKNKTQLTSNLNVHIGYNW